MKDDRDAVRSKADVELDATGAILLAESQGGQGVLRRIQSGRTMRDYSQWVSLLGLGRLRISIAVWITAGVAASATAIVTGAGGRLVVVGCTRRVCGRWDTPLKNYIENIDER